MLNAALDGKLDNVAYTTDPIFGFKVPQCCAGIPDGVMDPASSWPNPEAYMKRYKSLASRFVDNFKKFADQASDEVRASGPRI
jgi:phosphoenolpyruvate carboxykinase (ATP)